MLDQSSLLISIGLSAGALMLTLVLTWLGAPTSRYLLSWAIGLGLIVPGVLIYGLVEGYHPAWNYLAFTLLLAGFGAVTLGAARFRRSTASTDAAVLAWVFTSVAMGLAFLGDLAGLATIVCNLACAGWLAIAAREHWLAPAESPLLQRTMAGLYTVTALSFLACAAHLLFAGQFALAARPENWAESLNSISIIVAIPAAGAVAMTLHQLRATAAHRLLAMTDPLTGLLNRRALFDLKGVSALPTGTAVVMLDLDGFKTINDRFGHAVGDDVLRRFAAIVRRNVRDSDTAARLGGEEFCLVMPDLARADAHAVIERIRAELEASTPLSAEYGPPTVSAGFAISAGVSSTFDRLLREADRRLYRAKNAGRNRIFGPRLAA